MNVCRLCGIEGHDVEIGLVEWRQPVEGQKYQAVLRCLDRKACRARAAANAKLAKSA